MNFVVLKWSQKHQYKLMVLSIYVDRYRNTDV